MPARLVPALFSSMAEGYNGQRFLQDIMAGVIVGIVALPLAIAFGIASGVNPEQGIITAIVGGIIISLLSGSQVQIGGPTGAFIVVVFAIISEHGYSGLALATLMAGVILVLMGMARLGAVIKFIPYPMTVGFTAGIAVIIATGQLKDFLGLAISTPAADFPHKILDYSRHLDSFNPQALVVGLVAITLLIGWPRLTRKVPGSMVAILVTTALVHLVDLKVATIGSQFGAVPAVFPTPRLPVIDWRQVPVLIPHALTIALLGAIESLLSAVVADGMTGTRHRSNMELVAQGVANLAAPLFGGIPVTGAIARTATNIKNGAQTPVAGVVHGVVLLFILLFFGRWATLIPMATLAAVLLVVAYHMSEWRHFVRLLRSPRADILVMLCTFGLTVFVDLTVAIEAGVVLSALLFMHRMSQATEVRNITRELHEDFEREDELAIATREVPAGVEVFEIHGPFFFGAANQFKDTLSIVKSRPRVLILRMRHVPFLDATAMRAMEDMVDRIRREGTALILSGVSPALRTALLQGELRAKLVEVAILPDIDASLVEARRILAAGNG